MIHKFYLLEEDKLTLTNLKINKVENKIIISDVNNLEKLYKIPVYNKYKGIDYIPLQLPHELLIINSNIFSLYMILHSYNIDTEDTLDFFNNLKKLVKNKYNLLFYNFNFFLEDKKNVFIKILNDHYIDNINLVSTNLWKNLLVNKLGIIYLLIKFPELSNKQKDLIKDYNIPKKLFIIANNLKSLKYDLLETGTENNMIFHEFYNLKNSNLKIEDIKPNLFYYISINKTDINTTELVTSDFKNLDKIVKIFVKKVSKSNITLNDERKLVFNNYDWYYFNPNSRLDNITSIYLTYNNFIFTNEIIKKLFNFENFQSLKLLEYYYNVNIINENNKLLNIKLNIESRYLNNLIHLNKDDFEILSSNNYNKTFLISLCKKYENDSEKILDILSILFKNYIFPLKQNRCYLDNNFDNILYLSLLHHNIIYTNNKNYNELLHSKINDSIPFKLKNLYINLLKLIINLLNNDFENITYNQKFYSDYLHRNIIKIFFTNTDSIFIKLFREKISSHVFEKFRNIVYTNMLLLDITHKLNWNNLSKKLNYLNVFYSNNDIVYYQNKINKNIIPEYLDVKIKEIIENPIEMFKYLKNEKDFIKWTKFITNKILNIYNNSFSLGTNDLVNIGIMINLLFNIKEQNLKEENYNKFISFCNQNNKLILDNNRINLKIKECFNLKVNLNLGYLAKHLTSNEIINTFSFEYNDNEKKLLEKIEILTQKYLKYKNKYNELVKTNIIN
jgi:hypothetical protein